MPRFEIHNRTYDIVQRGRLAEVVEVDTLEFEPVRPPKKSKDRVIALAARDHVVQRAAEESLRQGVEWHQMRPAHYPRFLEAYIRQNHDIAYVDPVIETALRVRPRLLEWNRHFRG